jgi:hypothetical protein
MTENALPQRLARLIMTKSDYFGNVKSTIEEEIEPNDSVVAQVPAGRSDCLTITHNNSDNDEARAWNGKGKVVLWPLGHNQKYHFVGPDGDVVELFTPFAIAADGSGKTKIYRASDAGSLCPADVYGHTRPSPGETP